jgi:hypothetical protein
MAGPAFFQRPIHGCEQKNNLEWKFRKTKGYSEAKKKRPTGGDGFISAGSKQARRRQDSGAHENNMTRGAWLT